MNRAPIEHDIKCWPVHFQDVWDGLKKTEIRKLDRDYQVGDALLLSEWNPDTKTYTKRYICTTITHILKDCAGIEDGFGMLSFDSPVTTWIDTK